MSEYVGNVWLQYNSTPFHTAALTGQVAVLKAMHAKGGNLDQQGNGGFFAIHMAAMKGHVDAVNLLVELGGTKELQRRGLVFPSHTTHRQGLALCAVMVV